MINQSANESRLLAVGICCIVGIFVPNRLIIANVGDSRAVAGYYNSAGKLCARQLSNDQDEPRIETFTIPLTGNEPFIIFAYGPIWDNLTNEKAVRVVQRNLRNDSAKRLIAKALLKAAKKLNQKFDNWKNAPNEVRHDDMIAVVVFLGNGPAEPNAQSLSYVASSRGLTASNFSLVRGQ